MNGRTRRLGRLLSPAGSLRMVPMDHGISMGAPPGLEIPGPIAAALAKAGATCFTAHRGLVPTLAGNIGAAGLLLHLFASTDVGSSRVDLQACKLEYSIVSPK